MKKKSDHRSLNRIPRLSLIPEKSARFESTQLAEINQLENHSKVYNKIKNFIVRSNRKSEKKIKNEKRSRSNMKNYPVLVRSEEERQLMQSLGPHILPVLVQTPSQKQKSRKKLKSHSALENILQDRQEFMKNYFADIKKHRKSSNNEEISYTFPEVYAGKWKINGYIKGKYILLKGENKGKSVIKKYLYSDVCKLVRKNYENWVKDHFLAEIEQIYQF